MHVAWSFRVAFFFIAAVSLPVWGAENTTRAPIVSSAYPHMRLPLLRSDTVLAVDLATHTPLLAKNADRVGPIASITKLMTAMVILDAHLALQDPITITKADVDRLKGSHSRLALGTTLTRKQLLELALMVSENRAAAALARTYPGGTGAFVEAMNRKAVQLGMQQTRFVDPTGLRPGNVSTARELVHMVEAASHYPLIRKATTSRSTAVASGGKKRKTLVRYRNTDPLVGNREWDIRLSKTGYISESGRCLVVQATIAGHETAIVLLDSWGRLTRVGDANRIRRWLTTARRRESASRLTLLEKGRNDVTGGIETSASAAAPAR